MFVCLTILLILFIALVMVGLWTSCEDVYITTPALTSSGKLGTQRLDVGVFIAFIGSIGCLVVTGVLIGTFLNEVSYREQLEQTIKGMCESHYDSKFCKIDFVPVLPSVKESLIPASKE